MFTTVEQVKQIVTKMLGHSGRGGFITGTVHSINPLKIRLSDKLILTGSDLYVTENCIGVKGTHSFTGGTCNIRSPLKTGDGVLLICRPSGLDGSKYILLDKIQPYKETRNA